MTTRALLALTAALTLLGCAQDATPTGDPERELGSTPPAAAGEGAEPSTAFDVARFPYTAAEGKAQIFFTRPGTTRPSGSDPGEDPEVDDNLFELFSSAQHSVDVCLYEFGRDALIDGVVNALINEVPIRFVGDGDESDDDGYEVLAELGVQMSLRRPRDRIMHNKFAIVDQRWVITGSMNYSESGVMKNNNNVIIIDSPALAAQYQAEFDQMFEGELFGRKKAVIEDKPPLEVGERMMEAYFSPKDKIDQVVRGLLANAKVSVYFYIFSFTHRGIRDDLIALHNSGVEVMGIFDKSQARGRYSVDESLAAAGIPVFIDGNENTSGFAGGKLHHKVMIIDGATPDAVVITGSYNWSNAATNYNDENLMVLHGPDLTAPYIEELCRVVEVAVPHPDLVEAPVDLCATLLKQVRINEILPNPAGADGPNEFVEIVNTGAVTVDLGGWALGDRTSPTRHVFDSLVLPPAGAVVVWSGANPDPDGPTRLAASSGGLKLTNNTDEVVLRDDQDVIVDRVAYSAAPSGVSFNRVTDGTGAPGFARHDSLAPDGAAMSPGRQVDGAPWPAERDRRDVIINELFPNPSGADSGQEYVELVNIGPETADLSGWTLADGVGDSERVRHEFAAGELLEPGQAIVVFDKGDHSDVVGAIVSTTGSLSLNNTGDTITLRDASDPPGEGEIIDQVVYASSHDGVSLNRAADGVRGADLVDHDSVDGVTATSSPGLTTQGAIWGGGGTPVLVINELLPNPEGTDKGHEFVEIVNLGDAVADLSGAHLGDAVTEDRHTFPTGTLLPPGQVIVVFDSGVHDDIVGAVIASSGVLSLNNTGDLVFLYDRAGDVIDAVIYTSSSTGVSKNRAQDGNKDLDLVDHDEVPDAVGLSSPGTRVDGSAWGS